MREFNAVVLGGPSLFISLTRLVANFSAQAGGVGKSALTVRFMRGEFVENYDPTIQGAHARSPHTCLPHLTHIANRGIPKVYRSRWGNDMGSCCFLFYRLFYSRRLATFSLCIAVEFEFCVNNIAISPY